MDSVIKLISQQRTQDSRGVWRTEETYRQVYCNVNSISLTEFTEAGRNGLNPQYRFIVFHADYEGETICEYEGLRYSIYRTYRRGDDLELYVERKGGSNGTQSNA